MLVEGFGVVRIFRNYYATGGANVLFARATYQQYKCRIVA